MNLKKGNLVKVLTGKDKNKSGEIIEIINRLNKAKVKGINIVKKHLIGPGIKALPFDVGFMDAFDHTTTLLIHEAKQYKNKGLDWKKELEKRWKSPTQI